MIEPADKVEKREVPGETEPVGEAGVPKEPALPAVARSLLQGRLNGASVYDLDSGEVTGTADHRLPNNRRLVLSIDGTSATLRRESLLLGDPSSESVVVDTRTGLERVEFFGPSGYRSGEGAVAELRRMLATLDNAGGSGNGRSE